MLEKQKEQLFSSDENKSPSQSYGEHTLFSESNETAKKVINTAPAQKKLDKTVTSKDITMKNDKPKTGNADKKTNTLSAASAEKITFKKEPLKNIFDMPVKDPQELQEAIFSISFQSAEGLNDATDIAIKSFHDSVEVSKDNIEALFTSGNALVQAIETTNQEVSRFANQLFSDGVEASKDFLKCKTVNDVFTLQSNILKNTMESCLEEFIKMNGIALQYADKALTPLNEQTIATSKKLNYPYVSKA